MIRPLDRAARAFADAGSARLRELPTTSFLANVESWNGTSLTITWRGASVPAKRHASYTPTVGDRVVCKVVDNQVIVEDRVA